MPTEKRYTPFEYSGVECHAGWKKLYEPLMKACEEHDTAILQIKEKFGGLRFYVGGAPDWLYDLIDTVEAYSYHVCEFCGKTGRLRRYSWLKTLCDECAAKREADRGITEHTS